MEDLIHLALIWAGVFVAAYLAHRTKLTAVLYYLAFGAVMVNLGLLPEKSSEFIRGFAEVGIILIMFAQYNILSTEAFYTLMFTAFWVNVAVPITIKLWKPYLAGERSFGSASG